jgi:lipoprotein signal peptidase
VVDFVDFQWFPVFNVADMAVTFGILVMLITGLDEPDAVRGD